MTESRGDEKRSGGRVPVWKGYEWKQLDGAPQDGRAALPFPSPSGLSPHLVPAELEGPSTVFEITFSRCLYGETRRERPRHTVR